MKIGLFYGSSTCYTEIIAEKIQVILGTDLVELHNVREQSLHYMQHFDALICGIPTWDFGELQEDWERRWPELQTLNLQNKPFALFGLGDQLGYGQWFQDALGYLHDALLAQGGHPVGYWPNTGYTFESSQALTQDKLLFVGLALDEINQYQQTSARLNTWLAQIMLDISEKC